MGGRKIGRLDQSRPFIADKEIAVMDCYLRQGRDRPQIGMLPLQCCRIHTTRDMGRVIVDGLDLAAGRQCGLAHRGDVEPLVRRALEGPVVKVEAVDVDNCSRHTVSVNAEGRPGLPKRPLGSRHAASELRIIYTSIRVFLQVNFH